MNLHLAILISTIMVMFHALNLPCTPNQGNINSSVMLL